MKEKFEGQITLKGAMLAIKLPSRMAKAKTGIVVIGSRELLVVKKVPEILDGETVEGDEGV